MKAYWERDLGDAWCRCCYAWHPPEVSKLHLAEWRAADALRFPPEVLNALKNLRAPVETLREDERARH